MSPCATQVFCDIELVKEVEMYISHTEPAEHWTAAMFVHLNISMAKPVLLDTASKHGCDQKLYISRQWNVHLFVYDVVSNGPQ